jgi:hypothetical protein
MSRHALTKFEEGLIQNADQNVINLVQELVVSEIRRENTLILITIPMSGK